MNINKLQSLWLILACCLSVARPIHAFEPEISYQLDSFSNLYYNDSFGDTTSSTKYADTGLAQAFQLRFMLLQGMDSSSYLELHYELASQSVLYKNSGQIPPQPELSNSEGLYRAWDLNDGHDFDAQNTLSHNLDRLLYHKALDWADLMLGRQAITFGLSKFSNQADVLYPISLGSLITDYRQGVDAIRLEKPMGMLGVMDMGWVQGESQKKSAAFYRLKHHSDLAEYELTAINLYQDYLLTLGSQQAWGEVGLWQELSLIKDENLANEKARLSMGADHRFGDFLYMVEYHYNGLGHKQSSEYLNNALSSSLYQKGSVQLLAQQYAFFSASYLEGSRHQISFQYSINLNDASQLFSSIYGFNINELWDASLQLNLPIDSFVSDSNKETAEFSTYNQLLSLNLKALF